MYEYLSIMTPQLIAEVIAKESSDFPAILTKPEQLLKFLEINSDDIHFYDSFASSFSFRVPLSFAKRMKKGDKNDPLLRQVLSIGPAMQAPAAPFGFGADPVQDKKYQVLPGLIHKYYGRVLLVATGACSVHCRYCFRQSFPYQNAVLANDNWNNILNYIKADTSIEEVILSGGDPLVLSLDKLQKIGEALNDIPHLKYIRIHSRQPVVFPESIDGGVMRFFSELRLKTLLVIHANHPNELDNAVKKHLRLWGRFNIQMLNQSVLLKGVNDSIDILKALSHRLYALDVLPYYLHVLDKVAGSEHFLISKARSRQLIYQLGGQLPGFLVPALVYDEGGSYGKIRLI